MINSVQNKNYLYNGALNKDKINFFLDILKEKVAPKILEIGGGDGFLGQELSKFNKYIKYLNIDPSVKKGFNTKKTIFQIHPFSHQLAQQLQMLERPAVSGLPAV